MIKRIFSFSRRGRRCPAANKNASPQRIPLAALMMVAIAFSAVCFSTGCISLQSGLRKLLVVEPNSFNRPGDQRQQRAYRQVRPRIAVTDQSGLETAVKTTPAEPVQVKEPAKEPAKVEPLTATPKVEAEAKAPVEAKPEMKKEDPATYRELALLRPDDPVVRFNLGRSYLERGLVDQAVFELDMATSLDPKMAEGFLLLGRALRAKGQLDLAIAKLSAATQLDPKYTDAFIEIGICWDQRGFYQRAREAYRQALALSPDDPTIYNNMGVSFFYEGNYEEALKQYKKALQIDPTNAQTNNNLAVIAAQRGDFTLAYEYFTRAHGTAIAHNNVGYLLLRSGNLDDAIKHLREAVKMRPGSTTALSNLEAALRMSGKIAEAEQVHTQYMKAVQAEAAAKK